MTLQRSLRQPLVTRLRVASLAIALLAIAAAWQLGLDPRRLLNIDPARLSLAGDFFSAALVPALDYQKPVPDGTEALWLKIAKSSLITVKFALLAVSFSVAFGALLGGVSSTRWLALFDRASPGSRAGAYAVFTTARATIAVFRSVHELIWAVLFLAAFGAVDMVAVVAMAITYSGTFAKVFSEIIDETPSRVGQLLASAGVGKHASILFGVVPFAAPDAIAYMMYRFECGIRSAAVMGFLGIPTLGYYIKLSFDNLHFHEVWSYLYALAALVIAFDQWSGAVRRRIVRNTAGQHD